MKKILFVLIICFIRTMCIAQTRLTPGVIKGKNETFTIDKLMPFDSINYIGVYSINNKYNKGIPNYKDPRHMPMNPRNIHINSGEVYRLVNEVLDNKRNALKLNKEILYIGFIFKPDGVIVDIRFSLHENTIVSLEDIEAIDKLLRTNVKATFTGQEYRQQEAIYADVKTIVF